METYKCQACNGTGISTEDIRYTAEMFAHDEWMQSLVLNEFDQQDPIIIGGIEYEDVGEYVDENWESFTDLITRDNCPCYKCCASGEVDWVTNCMDNRIAA